MLNLKLGGSSIGESSSAGLTSSGGSSQPMAQLEYDHYDGQEGDEQSDEDESDDNEERTLTTGAASSLPMKKGEASSVGRASSVGGASVAEVSMGTFGSRSKSSDGFTKPKAPLAKQ